MMHASPAKLKARETTTTITTVTSSTPTNTTTPAAFQSDDATAASTPPTTTVVSPVPPSRSSASPGLHAGRSASGSNGSVTRAQQHKAHRDSISSCCGSSGLAHDTPRIVYGAGMITRLASELGRLHLSRPLIISSPSRIALARRIQALIPNLESRILDSAVVNVPTKVVDDAVARITGHDVVISVGAGSAIGLAKAVSIRKGIPHVCIPTTYSGSEMSPLLAADGRKMGHEGSKVMPTVIIYDEDLTGMNSTPKVISAPSPSAPESPGRRSHDDDASWSYIHLPGV